MATDHSGRFAGTGERAGLVAARALAGQMFPAATRAAMEAEFAEQRRRILFQDRAALAIAANCGVPGAQPVRVWHRYLVLAPAWLAPLSRRNRTGLRRRWWRWTLVDSVHTAFADGVPLREHGHHRYVRVGYFWTRVAANRQAERMREAGLDD